MAQRKVQGVHVAGIATAVPDRVVRNSDLAADFGDEDVQRIIRSVGVVERRVAPVGVCSSDLCLIAAERLLEELNWTRDSIDTLIFVSQTPDYILPATSCSLHERLRLPKTCSAFDLNLGCSGYTYGLWVAAQLLAGNPSSRALLLVGETATHRVSPLDRSAVFLFGDAGTATAVECRGDDQPMWFRTGTDGTGQNSLIVPAGGFRCPHSASTAQMAVGEDGNTRSLDQLYMSGSDVFLFTLDVVPDLILDTLKFANWAIDDVDAFVFHQANKFVLTHLAEAAGIPLEKVPMALAHFGNTSAASIPLTITETLRQACEERPIQVVLAGYGVGFSWSSVAATLDHPVLCPRIDVSMDDLLKSIRSDTSHLYPALRIPGDVT